jgi:hypothetical protein
LKKPLKDVKEYITSDNFEQKLKQDNLVSTFEVTIRILGGLLSAYDLTNENIYLKRATLLGDRLLKAFQSNGIPLGMVNLATGATSTVPAAKGYVIFAEIMTLQLEFFKLTEHTKNKKYRDAAQKTIDILMNIKKPLAGQFPIYITKEGASVGHLVSWGAMGDSGYEYLVKLYILTGKSNDQYRQMFVDATVGMLDYLYTEEGDSNAYIAN